MLYVGLLSFRFGPGWQGTGTGPLKILSDRSGPVWLSGWISDPRTGPIRGGSVRSGPGWSCCSLSVRVGRVVRYRVFIGSGLYRSGFEIQPVDWTDSRSDRFGLGFGFGSGFGLADPITGLVRGANLIDN